MKFPEKPVKLPVYIMASSAQKDHGIKCFISTFILKQK
ncbi:Hypothetical cytosolic protein [Lactobacillus helveticus H10]|nr:Hypothetical cytosolic protein [Lactobacillus helveticus H10]AFR21081.1 hypothetical protein R0052_00185 [Lactobacillus helveticus R0052]AFR21143.1 hypothetical protein R0052_00545 [Lactobacillus helveticus R0052]AFR22248.1 hypothetical protein R0052_07280 [Lactobacillus helveticus R0052]